MEYYIYMLISLAVMLTAIKLIFCELEGRTAQKKSILSWYTKLNEPFKYTRLCNYIPSSCIYWIVWYDRIPVVLLN